MPLVHSENIAEVGRLLVWQLVETEEVLRKMLPSSADFEELSSISHPQKKREWMAGRIVLAQIVAEAGEVFKGTWKDEHGKPFLIDCPYPISLTHTHDYVAAVIHPTLPVGIDMEQKNDKLIRTSRKYLTDPERARAADHLPTLCVYWCGKEALYKLNGRKKVSFKEAISLGDFVAEQVQTSGQVCDTDRILTARLHIRWQEEYCLVVAVQD